MKNRITRKRAAEILGVSLSRVGVLVASGKIDLNNPESLQIWANNKRNPNKYKITRKQAADILNLSLSRVDKLLYSKRIDLNNIDSLQEWANNKGRRKKPEQIKIKGKYQFEGQDVELKYPNNLLTLLYQNEPFQDYLNELNFDEKLSELFVEAKIRDLGKRVIYSRFRDKNTMRGIASENNCSRECVRVVLIKSVLGLQEALKRHIQIDIQPNTLLTKINLSNRVRNKLNKSDIESVQDLLNADLTKVKNLGKTSMKELDKVLSEIRGKITNEANK